MKKFVILILVLAVVIMLALVLARGREDRARTYTMEESQTIAKTWVETRSSTYTFDGSGLSLWSGNDVSRGDCKSCYEFTYTFKSAHGGYGDRADQVVIQVITPHVIEVEVERGKVVSAVTDGVFNELQETQLSEEEASPMSPQIADVFFYNKQADTTEEGQVACSPKSVQPVERIIPGQNPEEETFSLLLRGDIREEEAAEEFQTEFPNPDFQLRDVDVEGSTLTAVFTEVPGFTFGGSCRATLLRAQIKKTAGQFAEQVKIMPETLFQP